MPIDFRPRQFGKSQVMIPRIGLGAAPLGNVMGNVSDDDADQVLRAVFGGQQNNLVDTAPFYGEGLSEHRVGRGISDEKSKIIISTKVGRRIIIASNGNKQVINDFSYDGVMQSFDESLERLGVDKIDIVHIHDPDDHFEEAISGAYRALSVLKSEGLIGAISAGMNQWQMLSRFIDHADFDGFLLAGRYSLLDQSAEVDFLPKCQRHDIGLIIGGVFNGGILADPNGNQSFDYQEASSAIISRAQALNRICLCNDVPLRAAAIQFALRNPAVSGIIIGVKTAEEWISNMRLAQLPLEDAIWEQLQEV